MSRRGNCYDNAVMEAFFSSLKSELADRFESCGEAKMELFDYIEVFYNQRRRHSTLDYLSPGIRATRGYGRCRLRGRQRTCITSCSSRPRRTRVRSHEDGSIDESSLASLGLLTALAAN